MGHLPWDPPLHRFYVVWLEFVKDRDTLIEQSSNIL